MYLHKLKLTANKVDYMSEENILQIIRYLLSRLYAWGKCTANTVDAIKIFI